MLFLKPRKLKCCHDWSTRFTKTIRVSHFLQFSSHFVYSIFISFSEWVKLQSNYTGNMRRIHAVTLLNWLVEDTITIRCFIELSRISWYRVAIQVRRNSLKPNWILSIMGYEMSPWPEYAHSLKLLVILYTHNSWNRPWWCIDLWAIVRRRNPSRPETHRCRYIVDGQLGTRLERLAVLHYFGADTVAGQQACHFWSHSHWYADREAHRSSGNGQKRSANGDDQNSEGSHWKMLKTEWIFVKSNKQ